MQIAKKAIGILKTRFGNKQVIDNTHWDDVINIAPVTANHFFFQKPYTLLATLHLQSLYYN